MSHQALPNFSAEELQAAWAEVHAADWPSVAELLRHQARLHMVRAAAQRRREEALARKAERAAPPPAHHAHTGTHQRAPQRGPLPVQLDRKRAAAGERLDDDETP